MTATCVRILSQYVRIFGSKNSSCAQFAKLAVWDDDDEDSNHDDDIMRIVMTNDDHDKICWFSQSRSHPIFITSKTVCF